MPKPDAGWRVWAWDVHPEIVPKTDSCAMDMKVSPQQWQCHRPWMPNIVNPHWWHHFSIRAWAGAASTHEEFIVTYPPKPCFLRSSLFAAVLLEVEVQGAQVLVMRTHHLIATASSNWKAPVPAICTVQPSWIASTTTTLTEQELAGLMSTWELNGHEFISCYAMMLRYASNSRHDGCGMWLWHWRQCSAAGGGSSSRPNFMAKKSPNNDWSGCMSVACGLNASAVLGSRVCDGDLTGDPCFTKRSSMLLYDTSWPHLQLLCWRGICLTLQGSWRFRRLPWSCAKLFTQLPEQSSVTCAKQDSVTWHAVTLW